MAETSHGIITDDTNIGVSNVNEVNLTQPITHGTSPRNVTHNASDNTHTKSQNENGCHDKSATAATTQQNVSLGVQNLDSVITVDSLNSTPNNLQMVNKTIILTFLWNEIQYFNTLFPVIFSK